ncbi:MAG: hypothetical protein FJ288_00680 [Planctomycetes bacterium]|nr:hypothetical protein [Planctomycetota bacterium]
MSPSGTLLRAAAQAAVLAAALAAGCGQVNYTSPERYERGLVVCLSGAGGMMGECDRIREGLDSGGVDRAIEIFDWSRGEVFADQVSVEGNRRIAANLARHVEAYAQGHPGRPVHLVGISAGTGLIVWALEALQDGFQVDGAVILASSLDTRYDLSKSLARVRDRIWSFSSVADTVLSLGVTWAGTVDRGGGLAGGLVGFSPPDGAPDEAKTLYRDKLAQVPWWPGDVILGHLGDHLGATNPTFVRVRIAPLVLGKEPPKNGPPAAPKAQPGAAAPKPPALPGGNTQPPALPGARRFFGWLVRPSATAGEAASSAAPPATGRRPRPDRTPSAPPAIDESVFFSETGRLP